MDVNLPANGWRFRPHQKNAWSYLEHGGKRAVIVAHRRYGKDEIALHAAACSAFVKPATYWHMLPEYAQGRKAIWEAVNPHTGKRRIDEAFPLELRESTRENEMSIRFVNGAMWHVVGSDNYNKLVGSPPYGVVFSEWALADPAAWGYIMPILRENHGWAAFIYTPRGRNHGYTMYQHAMSTAGWYAEHSPASKTKALSEADLAETKAEYASLYGRDEGEALFNQEYECSFEAAVRGAFYASELARAKSEGRVSAVRHDPYIPVYTAWDLGYTDSTAVWFYQLAGREVHFIDYIEESQKSLLYYAELLNQRAQKNGYRYEKHFFPHDLQVHELTTGKSRVQVLRELNLPLEIVPQHSVLDGINAARRHFDRFWFDAEKCERGIDALALYRRDWDESGQVFKPKPVHDWTSHGADAFRQMAVMLPGESVARKVEERYRRERRVSSGSWMTA